MDHGIRFPFTVGVSAGACNGLYDEGYMIAQRLVTGSDDICIRKAKKA